jgi:hypothetical protein
VPRSWLVAFFLELKMTEYDYFTAIIAIVGGSILGSVILWDLVQEFKK